MKAKITMAQRFSAETLVAEKMDNEQAREIVIGRILDVAEIHHISKTHDAIDIFVDGSGLFAESIVLTNEQVIEFKAKYESAFDFDIDADESASKDHSPETELEDFFSELNRLFSDSHTLFNHC